MLDKVQREMVLALVRIRIRKSRDFLRAAVYTRDIEAAKAYYSDAYDWLEIREALEKAWQ